MTKTPKAKGFSYTVKQEQLEDYKNWSISRRMQWLLLGNKMRKSLPKETIKIQEAFRKGEL